MKTTLVAEIGINHNGAVDLAKNLIDVAVLGGCRYVKFQKRTVEDVYSKEELDKFRESPWGTTNRQQKLGLEFEKDEYDEIDQYCRDKKIEWFASPWDAKSVDFLMQYDPPFIKVASALITDHFLLEKIKESVKGTRTKIIVATGMSTEEEIKESVNIMGSHVEFILACTSSYPTPVEEINMLKITTLKRMFPEKKIGFSNHSQSTNFILMAQVLGAEMLEYHVTLDRTMYGSDQAASIEPVGVIRIGNIIKAYEKALGDGSLRVCPSEEPVKEKLRKK